MDKNNIQHKLTRIKPPRVRITFDVETYGSVQTVDLPFCIGVITNISGDNKPKNLSDSVFEDINAVNFDDYLSQISPIISFTVTLEEESLPVYLNIKSIADLDVYNICQSVSKLKEMVEEINTIVNFLARAETNDDLLNGIVDIIHEISSEDIEQLFEDINLQIIKSL
ncbi:hypothetical protein AB837_00135 [bacterium AB1]|nr:hypothetical protein AB837_00135 [bacterium AB1]